MPALPLPVDLAMDDIISNPTTLAWLLPDAVANSSNPAQPYDLVLTPMGHTSMVYIVVLTHTEENLMQGHTTVHGQYFDPNLTLSKINQDYPTRQRSSLSGGRLSKPTVRLLLLLLDECEGGTSGWYGRVCLGG